MCTVCVQVPHTCENFVKLCKSQYYDDSGECILYIRLDTYTHTHMHLTHSHKHSMHISTVYSEPDNWLIPFIMPPILIFKIPGFIIFIFFNLLSTITSPLPAVLNLYDCMRQNVYCTVSISASHCVQECHKGLPVRTYVKQTCQ